MDWERIDSSIFREQGVTPAEVDRMTLAEIAVCLEESGPRPIHGSHVSDSDREDYRRRWAAMTHKERLREGARELGIDV